MSERPFALQEGETLLQESAATHLLRPRRSLIGRLCRSYLTDRRALTLGRLDQDTLAGCLQNDLHALLAAAGLQGISFSVGRTAVVLGCLLLAYALVRGTLQLSQGENHGG